MIKLVICNLTGTDPLSEVNSNSKEIINITKLINKTDYAHCKILLHERGLFDDLDLYDYFDTTDYDAILVMNSNANFFGGAENPYIIETYRFLADNTKPIFYLYNDANLPFRQVWGNIKAKPWNRWTEEDVVVKAPFYVISQFKNLAEAKENNSKDIDVAGISYVDFGTWILYDYKSKFVNNQGVYDFIYGGSARGGKRKKKFDEYFDSTNLKFACYGSMKDKDLDCYTMPELLGRKASNKVLEMNSLGFSTMIFGENHYNNNIETIRIYESILAGCVTFIDHDFDSRHKIFDGYHYLYVRDKDELDRKISELKSNDSLLNEVKNIQLNYIDKKSKVDCIGQILAVIKEVVEN